MLGEIYELIDIFPYFQSAHLLLLKGLYCNSDVKFENQLKNSAIHVNDREVLYWLLKNNSAVPENKAIKPDEDNQASEWVSELKEPVSIHTTEIVTDTQQTVIEAVNSDSLINDIEKDSGVIRLDEKTGSAEHISGHGILIAAEPGSNEASGVIFLAR